jgi:hypothetical protein
VEIQEVSDASGRLWAPSPKAEVLLLGDSFSNIYGDRQGQDPHAGALGWGVSAGLPARLAARLGRDVDVIAMNGAGANGTRRELAKRPGQLAGTSIVIWQFSVRDLAVADWEVIPLSLRKSLPASSGAGPGVEMTVRLTAVSTVKQPGSVPYTEALTTLKGTVIEVSSGTYAQAEVLLVASCMEGNRLLDIARVRSGDTIHVHLRPWEQVAAQQGTKNTYDETDEFELARWWVDTWSR